MRKCGIPLVPRRGLYLKVDADALGWLHPWKLANPGEAFARCFREVWSTIPLGVRRRMLAYWRSRNVTPQFRIAFDELIRLGLDVESAAVARGACVLWFSPEFEAKAARGADRAVRHVRSTIAHELAHVFQWARDYETRIRTTMSPQESDRLEKEADDLAGAWGHPPVFKDRRYVLPKGRCCRE